MNGRKIIAWCPDDTDESGAREYTSGVPGDVAEQHAEFLHAKGGDPCESYEVRVRFTDDREVREWDICVDVDVVVSFHACRLLEAKLGKAADSTVNAGVLP